MNRMPRYELKKGVVAIATIKVIVTKPGNFVNTFLIYFLIFSIYFKIFVFHTVHQFLRKSAFPVKSCLIKKSFL